MTHAHRARHGGGDAASGLRRHLHAHLRAALSLRPAHEHASITSPKGASAGTSSPAISTARRGAWALPTSAPMTTAMRWRTIIWRWSTSSGRARGRRGAAVRDRAQGVFTDPAKVHRVHHQGPHYALDAIHLCEPSPQRTPCSIRPATSPRGARLCRAPCGSGVRLRPLRRSDRAARRACDRRAQENGRAAMTSASSPWPLIVGETEAAARAKLDDYRAHISREGALTLYSGWTGVDFSTMPMTSRSATSRTKPAAAPWTT